MFYVPMVFMLFVTICSLVQTITAKISAFAAGNADYWALIQAAIGVLLVALSIHLAVIAVKTLLDQRKRKTAESDKVA